MYGGDKVIEQVLHFVSNARKKIDACVDHTRPLLATEIEPLKNSLVYAKERGICLSYVTEITNDNVSCCKELTRMTGEIRHLDGIKGNFYISDTEYIAPATFHERGKPASQMIYSNVKEIVNHQQYVFDTLWNKAIPAEQKIKELEEGVSEFEVITYHERASQVLIDLAKSVKKEALFFLPNDKAMVRVDRLGVIDYIIDASQNGATIKIICPLSEENSKVVKRISERAPHIAILNGNKSLYGMYIIDSERCFRAELKHPKAEKFPDAIGFSVYSNRRNTVDFFKSVFELLWNERQLNEELIKADKMQKEFINVAAHELRTPIVPILGLSEILRSRTIKDTSSSDTSSSRKKQDLEMLDIVIRNAGRLGRLTEDILDVTKIESQSLRLKKERFDLNDAILITEEEFKGQTDTTSTPGGGDVKLLFETVDTINNKKPVFVEADKYRVIQVVSNLISNAIKFSKEGGGGGTVNVSIDREKREGGGVEDRVIVIVRDTGKGIDPEIFPKLFTKFVTKSYQGTGLGLFISKSIVEAHGGNIWAENNIQGKGATFYFTLPILDSEIQQR
jgi:two-component system, OmpR family, sensor histidine kinase VicK